MASRPLISTSNSFLVLLQSVLLTRNAKNYISKQQEFHRTMLPYFLLLLSLLAFPSASQPRSCLFLPSSTQLANPQHETQILQSCLACPPQCKSCASSDDLTCSDGNCESRYYFDYGKEVCLRCRKLCQECKDGQTCEKCIEGFYLESGGLCRACPVGAAECTSASILRCFDGYYYDTQAYVCRKCSDPLCDICSAKGKCDTCQSGYLLNNDATACLTCGIANCDLCLSPGTCSKCLIGFQLLSPTSCQPQPCFSLPNCLECSNTSTCTLCSPNFFLLDNGCHYGASLMCESAITWKYINDNQLQVQGNLFNRLTDYGSCARCREGIARLADQTQNYCLPALLGASEGSFVDFNVYNGYLMCSMPYIMVSQPAGYFSYVSQVPPAYRMTFTAVIVITNTTVNLNSLANPLSLLNFTVNLQSSLISSQLEPYPLYCSSPALPSTSLIAKLTLTYKLLTDSLSASSTVLQPLNLNLTLNKALPTLSSSSLSMKQSYIELSLCITQNCLQCFSASSCTKCIYPYFIQNFICVAKCDIGYYVNTVTRTCRSECEAGFFYDAGQAGTDSLCVACPSQCTKCSGTLNCSQCKPGFFLSVDGLCSTNCSTSQLSEYYPNQLENLCKKCENPCRSCSKEPKNCTSCLIGFHFMNSSYGICVFDCPIGFFQKVLIASNSQANPKCLPCNQNCLACEIEETLCTSCSSSNYLYGRVCVTQCPIGYFGSLDMVSYGDSPYCKPCNSPCSKCLGIETNCTECSFQLYLKVENGTGQCFSECPASLYSPNSSSYTCIRCSDSNCLSCQVNQNNCTQCFNGFLVQNGRCVANCANAWPVSGVCQKCPYPCGSCSGTGSNNYTCQSCVDGYYVDNGTGTCTLVCPFGTYGNWTNYSCLTCPSSCSSCNLAFNSSHLQCLSCSPSFILFNFTCTPLANGCPSSTYLSPLQAKCLACSSYCLECSGSQRNCTKCKTGTFLFAVSGECVAACPHGFYPDPLARLCIACDPLCSDCSMISTNCTLCRYESYKYFNRSTVSFSCLSSTECNALPGYYSNRHTSTCTVCQPPCLDCTSETICLSCNNNTFLFGNSCVSECSNGFYGSGRVCLVCPESCMTCVSQSQCLTCKPNYFYRALSMACLKQCPVTEFGNRGSMACEACQYPCLACLNREYCLTCNSTLANLIFLNGQCISGCPDGYFYHMENGTQECLQCNYSCETCSSLTLCLTCNFGFMLYQNQCLNSTLCPTGFYPDSSSRTCSKCQPPCLTCSSLYECTSCLPGHSLKQQSCYLSCPLGSFSRNGSCIKCPSTCTRCLNETQCLSCINGTFLFSNLVTGVSECVAVCPMASYFDIGQEECLACMEVCASCSERKNNCTSCPLNKALQNGVCLGNCSKFYYEKRMADIPRLCARCNDSCSECLSYETCLTCESAYLTQSFSNRSYCSLECPPATFKNSEKFICQSCQEGCLRCQNELNCLGCSLEDGYVLFNIKCIPSPCPKNLYTIVEENKCVQLSYCQSNPSVYFIFEKEKKCYRKDQEGCAKQLVLKNDVECIQKCPDGYVANFERLCVLSENEGQKFTLHSVNREGIIELMVAFNAEMNPSWINLFKNVTVNEGIAWKSSAKRLLLISQKLFQISEPVQLISNVLMLHLIPQSEILNPTDLTITVTLSQPYSSQIAINGLPLQNWQATTTIKSYMITDLQLFSDKSRTNALTVILILVSVAISLINIVKSGKIYLLLPIWDSMHLFYLMAFMNVYWPVSVRTFFSGFFITWLKWFDIHRDRLILSPEKVHAVAFDQNWISNLISNIVFMSISLLCYGIFLLASKIIKKRAKKARKDTCIDEMTIKKENQFAQSFSNCQIPLKVFIGVSYLCSANIVYFSLLNLFFNDKLNSNSTNYFIYPSALAIVIAIGLLTYFFYRQVKEKTLLDSGIHPLKKSIIISLPLYLVFRKIFVILFLAIFPSDPAFPLCFGLITTVFIFILVWWFEPFNNVLRYRITLIHEFTLFMFFLFSFVYVCNEREMMQGGFTGFLVFLAVLVFISGLAYPLYHLYVLLNVNYHVLKLIKRGEELENDEEAVKKCCIEEQTNQFNEKVKSIEEKKMEYEPPKGDEEDPSEILSCAKHIGILKDVNKQNLKENQSNMIKSQKKKKKIKLPKDKLIQGQTDHQADQSSQQGQRRKMRLADYTVRLIKKTAPVVNHFKNYDMDVNQGQNDDEGLAEKQIQLSKLIEKQKTLLRNKEKANEKPSDQP